MSRSPHTHLGRARLSLRHLGSRRGHVSDADIQVRRHLARPAPDKLQRTPRAPARLRPRLPQPDQLHRPMPTRGRRIQTPTTPSSVMSPYLHDLLRRPLAILGGRNPPSGRFGGRSFAVSAVAGCVDQPIYSPLTSTNASPDTRSPSSGTSQVRRTSGPPRRTTGSVVAVGEQAMGVAWLAVHVEGCRKEIRPPARTWPPD